VDKSVKLEKFVEMLLPKVKSNLILTHNEDDDLLSGFILAALDYAITYQKLEKPWRKLPPATMQAVVILASHWYESRDGGTGGFFADTAPAAVNVTNTVQRLLSVNKEYWHL
jgi:hypothetical protein